MILAGMAIMAISCAEPADPTPTQMAFGNWTVDEYYVNGQEDGSGILERFTLERDDSFLMEDNNGILFVGTWTATDTSLTLTDESGEVFEFTIVYQSYTKMQLLQEITSPSAGTIQIRYLMNWQSANTY